jgi:hypothetical protein
VASGKSTRRRGAWHYADRHGVRELRIAELEPARTWRGTIVFGEIAQGVFLGSLIDDAGREVGRIRGAVNLTP